MAWIPRVEGRTVSAIHSKIGSKKQIYCGGWGRVEDVAVAGPWFVIRFSNGEAIR